MAPPLLPGAESARRQIEEAVDAFARQQAEPPLFLLTGGAGSGKSTLLHKVAERARSRGLPPVHVTPPELELDAPAHALVQAAAALRRAGVNGKLDPVFAVDAAFPTKVDALVQAAARGPLVFLFRVPESWALPRLETPEKAGSAAQAWLLLRRLLESVAPQCPTVVIQEDATAWPEPARQRVRHLSIGVSSGATFLKDPGRWEALLPLATRLGEGLGPESTRLAPLTLRLGVALLALGHPLEKVRLATRSGFQGTANLLGEELLHRPHLLQALRRLSLARFPLPLAALRSLAGSTSLGEPERQVVEHVLLLELAEGWVLHPRVRREVADWVAAAEATRIEANISEQAVHAQLAQLHAQGHGEAWWEAGQSGAVAWMEDLFHSACAGRLRARAGSRLRRVPALGPGTSTEPPGRLPTSSAGVPRDPPLRPREQLCG